jgi:hypothetical protein
MKNPVMKKVSRLAMSGLWLALAFSHIVIGAQEPKGKTLDSALTQTIPTAQESRAKDPNAVLTSTAFTYQGQLKDADGPVNGPFDFQFRLYSAQTGGEQLGSIDMENLALSNGMFRLKLDFGRAAVEAQESWLEIGVRASGGAEPYTVLLPRQKMTPTPYAIFAQHEQWNLIGVPVGFADRAVMQEPARTLLDAQSPATLNETESPKPEANAAAPQGTANFVAKFDGSGNPTANSVMFDNGANVGLGTTSPTAKLDVRGHLTLDAGDSPVLYTGTAPSELSRYLQLINSPSSPSASGLKAGGILVSDSYSYANPGKNDMIVRGNVGVGTASPQSRLHISGTAGVFPFQGVTIDQTIGAAANLSGYSFQVRSTLLGRGPGQPGGTTTDFLVDSVGNVGIGTATPNHRLSIARGPSWTSNGWGGAIELTNGSAIGWQSNASGQRFGIGHTDGGLYFFRTSSDPGTAATAAKYDFVIQDDGRVALNVLQINGGSDFSENFDVSTATAPTGDHSPAQIEPGMVVSIDAQNPGKLVVSDHAYDRRVAGIISGAGGVKPGMVMGQAGSVANGARPVALTGRVYCWADASYGPIEPGNLLTTSGTPGHAMKVINDKKASGAIIGKAMTELKQGKGLVLVLVTLQ